MQKRVMASEATGNSNACLHPAATRHGRHAHKPLAATSLGLACTITKAHSAFFQHTRRPPRLCPCTKMPCNGAFLQRPPCTPQATAFAEKETLRRRACLQRERESTALASRHNELQWSERMRTWCGCGGRLAARCMYPRSSHKAQKEAPRERATHGLVAIMGPSDTEEARGETV